MLYEPARFKLQDAGRAARVDRYAKVSLVVAGLIARLGILLEEALDARVAGGFVAALGEAALIGGLADWYAVRALFTSPLGIRWHTAIIPRNKDRIIAELRALLMEQWLPPEAFCARIRKMDLVEVAGSLLGSEKARDGLVRALARSVAESISPSEVSAALSGPLSRSLARVDLAPFLARFLARARSEDWFAPLLRLWCSRMESWARSPQCTEIIFQGLYRAWTRYKDERAMHQLFGKLGELLGAVDLRSMSQKLQVELADLMGRQNRDDSDLHEILSKVLADLETRCRRDEAFGLKMQALVEAELDARFFQTMLEPVLQALFEDMERDLRRPDSVLVEKLVTQLSQGFEAVANDPERRERTNAWLRSRLESFVTRYHGRLGDLIEERLAEYSDDTLVEMVEARIGDDLNWIRINGACVGGCIGVVLHGIRLLAA